MAFVQAVIGYASPRLTVGCDYRWVFQLTPPLNAPYSESDLATLLATATVAASIVDSDQASTSILTLTGAVDDAPNRKIVVSATAAATAGLTPGIYRWKVRVTLPGASGAVVAVERLGPANVCAL